MKIFVLLAMFFCHIIDDFCLQTAWLANGKQRSWWGEKAPAPLYRYDYIAALVIHSFSWSFMTLLPIAIEQHFQVGTAFLVVFAMNAVIHGVVDNIKANKLKINLITNQSIHALQIIAAFLILEMLV